MEQIFCFFKKTLADWAFLSVAERGKFLELGFLLGSQACWNFDINADVEVAITIALDIFHSFGFEPEHRAGLCAGGNSDGGLAVQRGHFDFRPERRLHKAHRHFAKQIVAVALKNFMRLDVEHDV